MKRLFKILILTICIMIVSVPVFASNADVLTSDYGFGLYDPTIANGIDTDAIQVQLNGEFIDFTDENGQRVEPQIINNRTMVPMRKIFEAFGANVEWINETRSIKATTDALEIGLQIGNDKATLKNSSGDETEITLDSVPTVVNGRTLVPVRFIAESLDKKVDWDNENRTVVVIDPTIVRKKIEERASNLFEYLTTTTENITSSESTIKISGKVDYQDKDDRSNNTSLNITGNADIKTNEDLISIDLTLVATGKGLLKDKIKEVGLNKLNLELVIDLKNFVAYANLPEELVGKINANKWIKYEMPEESIQSLKETLALKGNKSGIEAIESAIIPETLNVSSYDLIDTTSDMICAMFSNDYFTVSGRRTKKYEYDVTLEDILPILGKTEEIDDSYSFRIKSSVSVSDGIAKESSFNITFGVEQGDEVLDIEIDAEATLDRYNREVKIEIPVVD